jgi:hypothetical protein
MSALANMPGLMRRSEFGILALDHRGAIYGIELRRHEV